MEGRRERVRRMGGEKRSMEEERGKKEKKREDPRDLFYIKSTRGARERERGKDGVKNRKYGT